MISSVIIGLNTKWYRYQKGLTQEKFSEMTGFKMAYLSLVENGEANLTCRNIDVIVQALNVKLKDLADEKTANKATKLPARVDMYNKNKR